LENEGGEDISKRNYRLMSQEALEEAIEANNNQLMASLKEYFTIHQNEVSKKFKNLIQLSKKNKQMEKEGHKNHMDQMIEEYLNL